MRPPTEKQAILLRHLADGAMALAPGRRDWGPLLRRGWVAAETEDDGSRYLPPLRITPEGLRALADAQERDGLPPIPGDRRQLNESPRITELKARLAERQQLLDESRRNELRLRARLAAVRRALGIEEATG